MKVLELFSGIGGMHYALQATGIHAEVTAIEINTIANDVYRLNFPSSKLLQKNILSVRVEDIHSIKPDMILMSPPCQPFTRVGLKKDLNDVRTDPLKHIISLLKELTYLKYLLVENVKGFEDSEARNKLIECLEGLNFDVREYLISPSQLGLPNTRTRYYLLAKRRPLQFSYESCSSLEQLPEEFGVVKDHLKSQFPEVKLISGILESNNVASDIYQDHLIPESLLEARTRVMDIVTADDTNSCCFTKAYGSYAKGTGSVYCPCDRMTIDLAVKEHNPEALRNLNLRYFTPKEIARLMCFPEDFAFPQHTTRKQKYRLLGNSINIKVVAILIKLMLSNL